MLNPPVTPFWLELRLEHPVCDEVPPFFSLIRLIGKLESWAFRGGSRERLALVGGEGRALDASVKRRLYHGWIRGFAWTDIRGSLSTIGESRHCLARFKAGGKVVDWCNPLRDEMVFYTCLHGKFIKRVLDISCYQKGIEKYEYDVVKNFELV